MWPKSERRKNILEILKEERKARQASADASANINDNADSICWFCHADVSNLENNKCAGCRKVNDNFALISYRKMFISFFSDAKLPKVYD